MSSTNLPSGTVTFLYTDIQGSAALWERFPEPMRIALEQHNAILNESIAAHGGTVFKVIGDAFQAAFPVALQAVMAAIAIQRALASAQWPETGPLSVRMGLHSGEAVPLEHDYDTTHTLNRVARIMSAGHGGQILISQAVAELVRASLPAEVTLKDLGQHRMKGLSHLERLSQVCTPDLPLDFPPLQTLDEHPNNLPLQLTTFLGRESEIEEVRQGLSASRLTTIFGPGGAGKTRLALEVGNQVLEEYPHGIWFVDLAPLQEASVIPYAVANALGLREQEGRQLVDQLRDSLHNKNLLLILDNCEHLIEACVHMVELALSSSPQVKVLATSRQSMRLTSERVYPLGGMDFPSAEYKGDLSHYPAVQLFKHSAQQVNSKFEPQDSDLEMIARICQLVQGMPLAILLAAVWIEVLDLEEIASEISRSVDFLETEMRDIPERQRSMRAVFDYSWNLLTEEEQTAFASLAVFVGGFDMRAAQAVSVTNLRMLNNLAQKSLLQRGSETKRFTIHEILRQLAKERLQTLGIEGAVQEAHSRYFLGYLVKAEPDLRGKRQLDVLDDIQVDFENVRAAWLWAVENRESELVNAALESLYLFTVFRNRFSEGYELFQRARQQWPLNDPQVSALGGRLSLHYPQAEADLEKLYRQGLDIANRYADPTDIAYATNQLGRHLAHSNIDFEGGMSLLEDSLSAYRQLGDDFAAAWVLDDLAFGYSWIDQEKRMQYGRQSLDLRRKIGDLIGVANVLRNLAVAAFWTGDIHTADEYIQEAIDIARQMDDLNNIGWLISLQAESSILKGDFEATRHQVEQSYQISQKVNDYDLTRNCLLMLSLLSSMMDEDYNQALQLARKGHPPGSAVDMLAVEAYLTYSLAHFGLGDYGQSAQYLAHLLSEAEHIGINIDGFPLILALIALNFYQAGEAHLAAQCLGYLDHLPKGLTGWKDNWKYLRTFRDDLEANLGQQAYQDALARGETLDIRTVTARFESMLT
jgi:predicted ATPase/class 3 adenylate cyclase